MANRSFVIKYIIKARDQFSTAADKAARSYDKMRKSVDRAKVSMNEFSRKSRNAGAIMTAAVTAPILMMAKSLKDAARDAVETRSKFNTVFKDIKTQANDSADSLAKAYGLAGTSARKLMGDTGDLLTGFGFTQEKTLKLATQVNQLAVDLASFTNYSGGAEGASAALTKALLGERESLKTLGIAILEEDVKAKVLEMRKKGMRFATLRQAKAEATLAIAMEQSKNAIGDYARTSQDLANQERKTAARIQDLKEKMGALLLPIALKLTKAIRGLVERFIDLSPQTQKIILVVGAVVAAIGPLLLIISAITFALPALITGIGFLASAFLPIVAVAAAAYAIYKNWHEVSGALAGITARLSEAFSVLWESLKKLWEILAPVLVPVLKFLGFVLLAALVGALGAVGIAIEVVVGLVSGLVTFFTSLVEIVKSVASVLGKLFTLTMPDWLKNVFSSDANVKITQELLNNSDANVNVTQELLNNRAPIDMNTRSLSDVNLNVGLDKGLKQTSSPVVKTNNAGNLNLGTYAL